MEVVQKEFNNQADNGGQLVNNMVVIVTIK